MSADAMLFPAVPAVRENERPKTVFSVAENVIKQNAKNVLRTIRQSFQWLSLSFASLKDSLSIGNLIKFTKIGEDTFAFGDFARSIMKISDNITSSIRIGIRNTISSFAENTLDLLWNVFKLFKALKNHQIFTLASKVFIPLQAVGGSAFAIASANRIRKQISKSTELLNEINNNPALDIATRRKNENIILARVYETAKNIWTIAIGTMLTIGAINGFIASSIVYLGLGTLILISEIYSSILQATYDFKL